MHASAKKSRCKIVKRAFFTLYVIISSAIAYTDSDMDGVEDDYDKCTQTPLSDLVDYDGCSIKSGKREIFYDIVFGSGYSQINYSSQQSADTINSYVQTDIYFDKWYFQGIASYYRSYTSASKEKGWDDTVLNLFYKFLSTEYLSLNLGGGITLPTYESGYNNEALDYRGSVNFEYSISERNYLFGGYSYTWINDKDRPILTYQNTKYFNVGVGYIPNSNATCNISYSSSDSIYKNIKTIQTLGIGYSLDIDPNWFIGAYYDYGLSSSASDHSISAHVGYYF